MIKDFTSKVLALALLLVGSYSIANARVVEVANSKNVISTSTTANTEAFRGSIADFDFSKMSFRAVINVDDATDGANLLTLSNTQISTSSSNYNSIQNGIHLYYAKSKENWRDTNTPKETLTNVIWVDVIQNSWDYGLAVYKQNVTGDAVIELKADGLYINEELILAKDQTVGDKTINPLIATGSKTLYYSWAEGSTRSTATYKEIATVGSSNKTISFNLLDEDNKTTCTALPTGSKGTGSAEVDLDNAILRFKLDITNCTAKSGSANYNLLNIGTGQCNGSWGTESGMDYGVHVYYRRQSSVIGSITHANGALWFDEVLNNNGGTLGSQGIVDAPANDVVIELRKDGIYVDGVNKIPSTTSGLSNLFTGGSKTIYYSNNEGTNQESQATYEVSVIPMVTLDGYLKEGEDNSEQCVDGAADKVKIERTLVANVWNTFCVPFSISNTEVKRIYGDATELRMFNSASDDIVYFSNTYTGAILAGRPCLVKPSKTAVNPIFNDVVFSAAEPCTEGIEGGVQMVGIYSPKTLNTDGTNLFLAAGNEFQQPASETLATMKGMRAYFVVPAGTDPAALRANIDGVETSISAIDADNTFVGNSAVYNLQGQRMGNTLNSLPRGIYIQNGKKVVVR